MDLGCEGWQVALGRDPDAWGEFGCDVRAGLGTPSVGDGAHRQAGDPASVFCLVPGPDGAPSRSASGARS